MALSRNIRGIWFGFIVAVCSIVTTLLVIIAMTDGRFGPWVLAPVLQAIVLTPGVNLILVIVLKKAFESVIAEDQANRLLEATPAAQQAAVAMDFIRTECSTCGRAVRFKADKIGKQFKCPGCGTVHTVPGS